MSLEAHLNRQAGLRDDAIRCRALWASVALNEMNRVSRMIRVFRSGRSVKEAEQADAEMAVFRRWLVSRDGRDVLTLAGIDHSERVVANILDAVWTGRAILFADKGHVN